MATAIEIIPATVPITVTNGDTLAWTTTILVDGDPVDLTESGTVVSVIVEYTNSQTNILTLTSDDVDPQITLGADGTAAVVITAAQTEDIDPGGYMYSLKWEKPDGTLRTLHAGPFTVIKPIA